MQLRYAQNLQLAACIIYCLLVEAPICFTVVIILLALKAVVVPQISRLVHRQMVFAGLLTGSLIIQSTIRLYQSNLTQQINVGNFVELVVIVVIIVLAWCSSSNTSSTDIAFVQKFIIPLYLMALSLVHSQQSKVNSTIHVGIFCTMCFLMKLRHQSITKVALTLIKLLIIYQLIGLYYNIHGIISFNVLLPRCKYNPLMIINLSATILLGDMLLIQQQANVASSQAAHKKRCISQYIPSSEDYQGEYIEMKELRRSLLGKQSEPVQANSNQENEEPPVQQRPTVEQSQSFNLILLLPFFTYNESLLELPVYIYIIVLEYMKPPNILRYLMYFSVTALYIIHEQSQWHVELLSASLILIMHWRVDEGDWLADLRALWLRWCFVVVLVVLCWFGLREVNLFHLGLMTILLLFITRSSQSGSRSFRNRNWKYLLMLFNVFVATRYIYSLIDGNPYKDGILELIGLSFDYNEDAKGMSDNFNTLPIIMLILIILQYWTYHSRIYQEKSKNVKQIFRSYLIPLRSISFAVQVVYYKSIIWMATLSIIVILLMEDFAISSSVLLAWVLGLLVLQICQVGPGLLVRFWLIFSRLIALQILVRYFFEFTKYKQIFKLLSSFSAFQFLVKYQKLLGLSVDYPSTLYLHTVTKFQLTIALDLVMVFLAFLAMEYLYIVVRSHASAHLGVIPVSDDPQEQKAYQIYHNYILFSVTHLQTFSMVKWLLVGIAKLFVRSFYLLVAIYCCININTASFLLLAIFCLYFEKWNSAQHNSIVGGTVMARVMEVYKSWLVSFRVSIDNVNKSLEELQESLIKQQLRIHNAVRKYIIFFLTMNIFLVYSAELFRKTQVLDFIQLETSVMMQWLLYLYGTSRLRANSYLSALAPHLLFCILLIIELKVCRFLEKLINLQYNRHQDELLQYNNSPNIEPNLREFPSDQLTNSQIAPQEPFSHNYSLSEIKQIKSETSMRVSLHLALSKITERLYVMLLVISSTMRITPESIPYVLIAFALNYYGTQGLLLTSRLLSAVIITEYSFALLNFQNENVYPAQPVQFMALTQKWNPMSILGIESNWIQYLTFGKDNTELLILLISILLVASMQVYYQSIVSTAKWIIKFISNRRKPTLRERFHRFFKQAYRFLVVLNPLYITLFSVALYLSDFTLPNLLLCCLSVGFLLREYMADELSDRQTSATFWKAYFRLLQGAIIAFLLVYYFLTIPAYKNYCTPLLCTEMSTISKITKALLVFLFQVGVDLLKSNEYSFHMDKFYEYSRKRSQVLKIAIAQRENDRRLEERFRIIDKRSRIHNNLGEVLEFLHKRKIEPQSRDFNRDLLIPYNLNFLNSLLEFLANLIDPLIMKPLKDTQLYVEGLNLPFVRFKNINREHLCDLPGQYDKQFIEEDRTPEELIDLVLIIKKEIYARQLKQKQSYNTIVHAHERESIVEQVRQPGGIIPQQIQQEVRQTVIVETADIHDEQKKHVAAVEVKSRQQRRYLYLLTLETILSNWQHLTFFIMVIEFAINSGVFMVYYPFAVFLFGITQQYLAGKQFWRVTFMWTLCLIALKYLLALKILSLSTTYVELLIGRNPQTIVCEFFILYTVFCQSFLMHTIGLFKETVPQVESMKLALIRNILIRQSDSECLQLNKLLKETPEEPYSFYEQTFSKSQHKTGYDYSTFVTTVELVCLAYSFLFYDRMFLDGSIQVQSVVEYNQFTGGMVIWLLLQLVIALLDRFIVLLNLQDYGGKWDFSLCLKFTLQLCTISIVHYMMVWFIPTKSASHSINIYAMGFYFLYCLYFLLSALQIRDGIDRTSRGFMDRYVWYNGYVYTALRVTPFLFEFKVFSDWFVSRTTMRLFDWIKFEDLFGRLFVAKCNSLFLQGKRMGSKIQWWKKLLMGCPLLLCIVLLIFGPLVLFSSLNPLAALNGIVGCSAYLTLKINGSNAYPLFINSHMSAIQTPTEEQFQRPDVAYIIQNYNIQRETVQLVNLEAYSDYQWYISEGSERKLLEQSDKSLWQLLLTIKFYRQHTQATPVFTISTNEVPTNRVSELKQTLKAQRTFTVPDFYQPYIRLDNKNGLHMLTQQRKSITIYAERAQKSQNKQWMIEGGLNFLIVSDKYSPAIFGYSVMGFYLSIILVVANYFRFVFQGGANLIALTDIPVADPLLTICEGIYLARLQGDLPQEDRLFWTLIDLVRSPDTVKLLTGNYLDARLKTIQQQFIQRKEE